MTHKKVTEIIFITIFILGSLFFVTQAQAAFSCDGGTLNTTCYASTTKTLTNGETITGTGNLEILSGGNLTIAAGSSFNINMTGVNSTITIRSGGTITGNVIATSTNFTIDNGGSINVNSKGYTGVTGGNCSTASGPGGGSCLAPSSYVGGGGAYGGVGGKGKFGTSYPNGGSAYGSPIEPNSLGSAGGGYSNASPGGAGGGLIKIISSGEVSINGSVSSEGGGTTRAHAGGGSGGSIWIQSEIINGSGTISVNGGYGYATTSSSSYGGGGGGGRLYISHSAGDISSVTMTAYGGSGGYQMGSAGTILVKNSTHAHSGKLVLDSGGATSIYRSAPAIDTLAAYTFDEVIIGNYITANGLISTGDFSINTGATITHSSNVDTKVSYLDISATGNTIIEGVINVNGKGYSAGIGPNCTTGYGPGGGSCSAPGPYLGGGGAYGGSGGKGKYGSTVFPNGGSPNGSAIEPNDLGSAGGGYTGLAGAGGGSVKIITGGNFILNGSISSNGVSTLSQSSGAGSGGSVWIQAGSISGSGSITADGGLGTTTSSIPGGGGGGGRLYISHSTGDVSSLTMTAYGGDAGYQMGSVGTIVIKNGTHTQSGRLIYDSGGATSAYQAVSASDSLTPYSFDEVIIRNYILINGIINTVDLNVELGASLSHSSNTNTKTNYLEVYASGNATIDGYVTVSRKGYSGGPGVTCASGNGAGGGGCSVPSTVVGGGGGYGGTGGRGKYSTTYPSGGSIYGSSTQPTDLGSAGGGATTVAGGAGGGYIKMFVNNTLSLSGLIYANGANASASSYYGGGSGGSIWIQAATISGVGSISADGGDATTTPTDSGGGGGGGRIAIYYNILDPNITISANGGLAKYEAGQSGTIYTLQITSPTAPQGLQVTSTNEQAELSWSAPVDNGGSIITGYKIYNASSNSILSSVSSTTLTYTNSGLVNGQNYSYYVTATNAFGESASSSVVSATPSTLPSAPTDLVATLGNQSATISFSPASDGGSSVLYYYASSTPGDFTATSTGSPIVVTGLTNGTSYTFTIIAVNANGSSTESLASNAVAPSYISSAPTGVSGVAGNASVLLSWTSPIDNGGSEVTSYYITNDKGISTTTSATTGATISGLANGTVYTFSVYAINSAGTSTAGVSGSLTPFTIPDIPLTPSASSGNTTVSLSWSTPSSDGGSAITGYKVYNSPSNILATTTTSTSTSITGLTNGISYSYYITALNTAGESASSSVVSATPATVPSAPTIGSATAGNAQASITFTPTSDGGSSVLYYTAVSNPGNFTATSTGSPIVVTGLTNGTSYTFSVTATNGVGTSSTSDSSVVVIPRTIPDAPTNLAAAIDSSSIGLSWSTPNFNGGSALTDYVVEYKLSAGGSWSPFEDTVSTSTLTTVTGLSNNSSYDFRVSAVNVAGQGAASDSVSAAPGSSAQVLIRSFSSVLVPNILTNIRITNEGSVAYEYQYQWCITDSESNLCGGGDDVYSASAAKLINPAENFDSTASSTLESTGNYWFHVKVTYGSATSYAHRSFTAVSFVATAPSAPLTPSASSGNTTISLSWSAPSSDGGSAITGYKVYNSPSNILATTTTSTSTSITGLTNGISYSYYITALNTAGESASSSVVSATPAAPSPPRSGGGSSGGGAHFGCRDPKALNYEYSSASKPELCEYAPIQDLAPKPLSVYSFNIDLKFGSNGEDVKQLQVFLNSQGFFVSSFGPGSIGNETSYFGPATVSALAKYQKSKNIIPAIGYFGPVTRLFINSAQSVLTPASTTTATSTYHFVKDLESGMVDPDVKQLQIYLNKHGYVVSESGPGSLGNETERFGEATRAALIRFQKEKGISPAVGYFGVKTRFSVNSL